MNPSRLLRHMENNKSFDLYPLISSFLSQYQFLSVSVAIRCKRITKMLKLSDKKKSLSFSVGGDETHGDTDD